MNENEELNYRMVYIVTAGNYVYGEEGDYGTAFRVVDVCSSLELAEMVAAVTTSVNPIVKLGVDCSNTLAFLQAKQYPFMFRWSAVESSIVAPLMPRALMGGWCRACQRRDGPQTQAPNIVGWFCMVISGHETKHKLKSL